MSAARDDSGGWLRERLGWAPLTAALAAYRIPRGNIAFYLGGTTLFLLLVQVASGIMLTLYYKPDAAQAFRSVERITGEIEYGNLVHSFHVWSSDLFIACLFAHLFFVLVRRGFRAPHELSWLTGLMGLVLGVGLAFTGDILPWSQRAYTDARVGSEFAKYVPLVGTWLNRFL
ncbi:MAG: cytochrome b N-terminal domain-containing protein, partial [Myxococcales bacterium]